MRLLISLWMRRATLAVISTKDPSEIPEVAAFEEAKNLLKSFKAQNQPVIDKLAEFVEHYNQTREAADKAVRAAGVRCGDFDLYQQVLKTDGEKVLNAVGRELFIQMGGNVKQKSEAKIGVKQLQTALARGIISQDLFDEVTKTENRYHSPPAGALP